LSEPGWREVEEILAAALEVPAGARVALIDERCADRTELRAEVMSLLEAYDQSEGFIEAQTFAGGLVSPIAAQDLTGRRIGPYRITEPIGRGGMGAVYRAMRDDDQFQKLVAIKVLEPGMQTSQTLQRFRSERQVLAALEHPNIARLLDSGVTEDGIPYIVMEHVEGVPIDAFCRTNKLPINERLRLFCAICTAVHFAHQHLVVHRDIKVENILVTGDGVPKLLDFGIAKILDASPTLAAPSATLAMWQPMTPDWASPEQMRGETITTASDIYSLGVLMYRLLAERHPYSLSEKPLTEVARIVCERDPERPGVSEDLDAIILKAMRKEARDRYSSAEEFANDIGRCLKGLPVAARRGTLRYVARKFVNRNKLSVASAAAVLLLIVAGLAGTIWQARIAERERAKAQRRFDEVRQLARSVIFDFHDGIARLPGTIEVRRLMVTKALAYLDNLAKDAAGDPALQMELAAGYDRVGRLQGHPSLANLGDTTGALASLEKARQILSELTNAGPQRDNATRELAQVLETIATIHQVRSEYPVATARAKEALSLRQAMMAQHPSDTTLKRGVAGAHFIIANILQAQKLPEHFEHRRQAIEIYESILAANPSNSEAQRNVALSSKMLGGYLLDHSLQQSYPYLKRAIELDERRALANREDTQAKLDLAIDLSQMGSYYEMSGDLAKGLDFFLRSTQIRKSLAEADPKDARVKGRLIFTVNYVGYLQERLGQTAASLESFSQSLQLAEELLALDPLNSENSRFLFSALTGLTIAEARLAKKSREHRANACAMLSRVRRLFPQLPKLGGGNSFEVLRLTQAEKDTAALGCAGT
jgi:eukaryotic-like serine/threonine-protein kinase